MRTPPHHAGSIRPERVLFATSIVLGLVCAWAGRYSMISDGISYLDLGDAYLRGDWTAAANAYWSPLYPCLLGIAMRVFRPSIWWQFPVVHLVNFFCFLTALFSFRYLMRCLLSEHRQDRPPLNGQGFSPLPEWSLWTMGYALFLWCELDLIGLWIVTPDILLSAAIFLLGGLLLRLRDRVSYPAFLAFGLVLGAAYLTKGAMFPLAFAFLAIVFFSGKLTKARVLRIVAATFVFLAVSSPLIFLLSRAKGRLTFGDTGKLAYAWLVSPGAPGINWQGGPRDVPLHPTRKIVDHPPVYEFAEPVGGSFPPWYDPSYWNDGLRPHFKLRPQVRVLLASLSECLTLLVGQSGWLAGVLIFILIGRRSALQGIVYNWPLLAASLAAVGLYSLVLLLPRYVGAFLVLLGMAVLAGIRLPRPELDLMGRYVAIGTVITMGVSLIQPLVEMGYKGWAGGSPQAIQEPMRAADGLANMGLLPGDRVATIGAGVIDFWPRLAGLRIVAQIMQESAGADEFWNSPTQRKDLIYSAIAGTGARAVVTWNASGASLGPGWQRIPGTFYHVYFLAK